VGLESFAGRVLVLPVLNGLFTAVASINALLAWRPLAGADLTVLLVVLEGEDEAEDLIDISANGEIIELLVAQDSVSIDDEGSAEVESIISSKASVVAAKLLGKICKHGNLHSAEATLLAGLLCELSMSEVRVN